MMSVEAQSATRPPVAAQVEKKEAEAATLPTSSVSRMEPRLFAKPPADVTSREDDDDEEEEDSDDASEHVFSLRFYVPGGAHTTNYLCVFTYLVSKYDSVSDSDFGLI